MKYKTKCIPMDNEWKNNLKDFWWATNYTGNISELSKNQKDLLQLRDRLLSYGGEQACFAYIEDDLDKIMSRGKIFVGPGNTKMMKGQPSQCHKNSCNLYQANKGVNDLRICTGYALSKDGMWRQHSWLIWFKDDNTFKIVETTTRRELYFGFIMNEVEANNFCLDNY